MMKSGRAMSAYAAMSEERVSAKVGSSGQLANGCAEPSALIMGVNLSDTPDFNVRLQYHPQKSPFFLIS
jgi:hypothetical protein